jgi:hypothetical protein
MAVDFHNGFTAGVAPLTRLSGSGQGCWKRGMMGANPTCYRGVNRPLILISLNPARRNHFLFNLFSGS